MNTKKSKEAGALKPRAANKSQIVKTSSNFTNAETLNSTVGIVGCFVENAGEAIVEFDNKFYDIDSNSVKIKGDDVIQVIGVMWKKLEESYGECLDKEIKIEFGDSPTANLAEMLVKFLTQSI